MKKVINILYIALILLFLYAPIFVLTLYSFVDSTVVSFAYLKNGLSFELYKELFRSEELMKIVFDTFLLAFISATLATILGTLGAIGIYYSKGKDNEIHKVVSKATACLLIKEEKVNSKNCDAYKVYNAEKEPLLKIFLYSVEIIRENKDCISAYQASDNVRCTNVLPTPSNSEKQSKSDKCEIHCGAENRKSHLY